MVDPNELDRTTFELEVVNVARNLWPQDESSGALIIDGRESDGIFITDDVINLVECTISRAKDKAHHDCSKLAKNIKKYQKHNNDKVVKGWFITREEPTADQRTVVKSFEGITTISYERFRSKLLDVLLYKQCRSNYPFGSVRDPMTGDVKYSGEYILSDFTDVKDSHKSYSISDIYDFLNSNKNVIIQGHYGVGKSMALKQIYLKLMNDYEGRNTYKFPIYINLRDHQGQVNPVEVIERHARNIGFKNPEHIVRAWRAGYVILILDGFDEIAAFGWAGGTRTLKDIRYKSMELIREFIKQNPKKSEYIIAGRINYFDSNKECEKSFGINSNTIIVKLGDFTHEQTEEYLRKKNVNKALPNWIPTRPLLLGYIVSKGILEKLLEQGNVDIPSEGWDYLIDEICKRESLIEAGLSPEVVREIIEGIASYCRQFQTGLGPIYQIDLEYIFSKVCGYPPDERALILLQRLPGLSPSDQQDGARYLIDYMFTSVAKAGEVSKFVSNPYEFKITGECRKWQECLDELGIQALTNKICLLGEGLAEDALMQARKLGADILSLDILMAINYMGRSWNRERIEIKDALIPMFEMDQNVDLSRIHFRDVIFKEFMIETMPNKERAPVLINCIIGKLVGCSNISQLPANLFESTVIDSYEENDTTTSGLLGLDLPIVSRVGLTILKKLYLQTGNGRQQNAFYRGLSTNEQAYVVPILELFKREMIALPSKQSGSNNVWQPVKAQFGRVRNIIINRSYSDPLLTLISNLN